MNSLSRIDGLQVAARTSLFSFQGEHPGIATVAHKLNVASVLEGSVRRSGHTIRVTASTQQRGYALAYAAVYVQWGATSKALEWVETAARLGDPYLKTLKVNPVFDPLRNEPRFQAVERALKFPD